jgi:hypothetical protein
MTAAKKKNALAVSKTLKHNSGVRRESQTFRELLQSKRKAEDLSSLGCPSEPVAALRPGIC